MDSHIKNINNHYTFLVHSLYRDEKCTLLYKWKYYILTTSVFLIILDLSLLETWKSSTHKWKVVNFIRILEISGKICYKNLIGRLKYQQKWNKNLIKRIFLGWESKYLYLILSSKGPCHNWQTCISMIHVFILLSGCQLVILWWENVSWLCTYIN